MAITGYIKREVYVNKENYCVINFVLAYVIIMCCRIDDIQDNSILRRGIPAAHTVYGVASTINAANYLLLKGLKKVQRLNHPDAITVATEQLLDLYYCQGLEIYWRDNYTCPSLEEYKQMIKNSKDRTEP
jgi:geranylgeranyl pyrophosphate synthase